MSDGNHTGDGNGRITDKTWVPLGLSVSILIGAILLASNWTTRFVRVESTLVQVVDELRSMNSRMERGEQNALSKTEFRGYMAIVEARNPSMAVPPTPN